MGAGKTSVGKVLAARLGWNFCDLDAWIEKHEQRTIAAIFAESGETAFREIENAALLDLLSRNAPGNWIIALGGGTFVQPRNRIALQQAGAITVLLDTSLNELKRRCKSDGIMRPLAHEEIKIEQVFASRREAYSLAQFKIGTTGKPIETVAAEIEQLLESNGEELKPER